MNSYADIETIDQITRAEFETGGKDLELAFNCTADELEKPHEIWIARACNETALHVLYCPDADRAGIIHGGDAVWTDASSAVDAIERYFGDEEKEVAD